MRKVIFASIFFKIILHANFSFSDTVTYWRFYLNDSIIYSETINIFHDSSGHSISNPKLPTIKLNNFDFLHDSLGLYFNSNGFENEHDFFFIKNEDDELVYATRRKSILSFFFGRYFVRYIQAPVYIPLWKLLDYPPYKDHSITLKIYFRSTHLQPQFPDDRLIGIIQFYKKE